MGKPAGGFTLPVGKPYLWVNPTRRLRGGGSRGRQQQRQQQQQQQQQQQHVGSSYDQYLSSAALLAADAAWTRLTSCLRNAIMTKQPTCRLFYCMAVRFYHLRIVHPNRRGADFRLPSTGPVSSALLVPEPSRQRTTQHTLALPYKQKEPQSIRLGFLHWVSAVATPQSYRPQ